MRGIFSSFPSGLPGSGLLLLRLVLAIHLIAEGTLMTAVLNGANDVKSAAAGAFGLLQMFCGALAAAGFLTPIIPTIVAVVELGSVGDRLTTIDSAMMAAGSWDAAILAIAIAASLALLGPGAYSIDAHLFGRREIYIPPRATASGVTDSTSHRVPARTESGSTL
ncbi:MAG: hypothetical protein ACRDFA_11180 [bacterium]